jgi:hypothetical protein
MILENKEKKGSGGRTAEEREGDRDRPGVASRYLRLSLLTILQKPP